MPSPRLKSRSGALVLALCLTLLVGALAGVSAYRKVMSFQPLGFTPAERGSVLTVARVDQAATGLEPGDQILLIDGREAARPLDDLSGRAASELLVMRGGELVTVEYQRPRLEIDYSYLILTLIGVAYLGIGLFVLFRQPGSPGGLFHLWCLASAAFFLLSPVFVAQGAPPRDGLDRAIYLVDELARIWLAPLTVHLFLAFPQPLARLGSVRRLLPFVYLPAAVLTALQADLVFFDGRFAFGRPSRTAILLLERLELVHLVVFAFASAAVLALRLRRQQGWEQHRQLQWIAVGIEQREQLLIPDGGGRGVQRAPGRRRNVGSTSVVYQSQCHADVSFGKGIGRQNAATRGPSVRRDVSHLEAQIAESERELEAIGARFAPTRFMRNAMLSIALLGCSAGLIHLTGGLMSTAAAVHPRRARCPWTSPRRAGGLRGCRMRYRAYARNRRS